MGSRRDEQEDQKTAPAAIPSSSERQQQEIREAIVSAFDEAKDKTQRAVKEAKKEVPRYTEAVHSYQEKLIEVAREIAENHIDSQKEIIKLLQQSSWMRWLGELGYRSFWPNWISSKGMSETFADVVSNYVDNNFAAVRFYNEMMSVNGEALKNSWSQAKDNLKVFSKITLDSAKMFEHIFGDYAKMSMNHTGTNIRIR
jgi:NADH dehydrogenase/NADH:ubiquinone oxidoreductase subunit G